MGEVVATVALIGVAIYMVPQFLSTYNPRPQTVKRTCESYAQSIVSVAQEETTYKDIVQWMDNPNNRGITSPTFTSNPRAITTSSDYWTPLASYTITNNPTAGAESTGTRLQNAALVQGTVRTLAVIYNRNVGVRCPTFGTYAPLTTNITVPVLLQGYSPSATISIEPYLISTNASVCDGTFKLPIPRPSGSTAGANVFTVGSANTNIASVEASYHAANPAPTYLATDDNYSIANVSGGNADLGFRLKVRVSYTVDGNNYTCESSQNFEYPMDKTPPAVPNDVVITTNTSLSPSQENCTATLNSKQAVVRIGYTAGNTPERGTVLLCRDLSYTQNRRPYYGSATFDPATSDNYSGACIPSAGTATPPVATGGLSPFPRLRVTSPGGTAEANNPEFNYQWDKAYRDFTSRQNYWKPCDQLSLCGVSATTASSTYGTTSMTLTYDSVPVGCLLNFEVVGVDTAGNRSNPASPAAMGAFPTTSITEGRIIFPPTCGNSTSCSTSGQTCTALGKANYSNFYVFGGDSGYYVDRRGVFCKPTTNVADDGNRTAMEAEPNATLHWHTSTVGGQNWRTVFPNGYYTCRGAFGGSGGAGGSGSQGCCWDPPGVTTCTPYN